MLRLFDYSREAGSGVSMEKLIGLLEWLEKGSIEVFF